MDRETLEQLLEDQTEVRITVAGRTLAGYITELNNDCSAFELDTGERGRLPWVQVSRVERMVAGR